MTPCTVSDYFLSRRVQNGMVEGLCFMSKFSYMTEFRLLILRSYFSVAPYLATVGVFVYIESDSFLNQTQKKREERKDIERENNLIPSPTYRIACLHLVKKLQQHVLKIIV